MFATISTRFIASKITPAVSRATSATSSDSLKQPIIGMRITPYAMFVKQNFKNDVNKKNSELMKELSAKWNNLKIDEKNKYTELSEKHYEKKLEEFKKLSTSEQENLVKIAAEKKADRASRKHRKELREIRKLEGRPTIPPNAYALFIKEKVVGSGEHAREKLKEAVVEWKTLTDSQKSKYTTEATKLNKQYHEDIAKWEAERAEKKEQKAH
uniref:HMG box domain-containing protein n=1 Tax=Caenorhabditis japonica TaxID=281687 RepID=A0A8R1I302_CAEJA